MNSMVIEQHKKDRITEQKKNVREKRAAATTLTASHEISDPTIT